MNIIIRDGQGLDTALMMDGYSMVERQEAKQIIRSQFRETSHKVFEEVLDKPLPDSMTINMAISDREELSGESGARLASFNVALSRANSAMFTIREITVKTILDHKDLTLFKSTVTHEMFHAADKQMLENSHRLFDDIRDDIAESSDDFNRHNEDANVALLRTLLVFNHYRAEGVALLGESLLMKTKFSSVNGAIERFCSLFELTMMRARMRTSGKRSVDIFDKNISHEAYSVAPIILLLVLGKRRDISPELSTKALVCLESGDIQPDRRRNYHYHAGRIINNTYRLYARSYNFGKSSVTNQTFSRFLRFSAARCRRRQHLSIRETYHFKQNSR